MNNVRNSEKKLVVLSAPSGAGKSSLLNNVISQHHDIGLTISHTTRDIRPSEKNNIDLESVPKIISKPLKEKIKWNAMKLNFLKKTTRAKLPI